MAMRRLIALLLVLMLGSTVLSGCSSSPSELTRVRLCEVTHSIFLPRSMWPCIKAF